MHIIRLAALGLGILLTMVGRANGAIPDVQIGAATVVVNSVYGTPVSTQQSLWLRPGMDVFQNEAILTGENSASRMLFKDDTQIFIGAISYLRLDKFVYDPDPSTSAVVLSFVKGVFRFVGGKLSEDRYSIHTPAASITVRGTAFTVLILPRGSEYISVESGTIYVTCHRGATQAVHAGEMTYIRSPQGSPSAAQPAIPLPAVTQMDALLR